MFPPRIELRTLRVLSARDNHYTTETDWNHCWLNVEVIWKFEESWALLKGSTSTAYPIILWTSRRTHFSMSSRILFEVFQIWIDNQHWLEGNWEGFLSIEHYRVTVSWCYPGRGCKVSSPTILHWCSVLIVELKKFYYIFLLAYLIMFLTLIHGVIYNLSEFFVLGFWTLLPCRNK